MLNRRSFLAATCGALTFGHSTGAHAQSLEESMVLRRPMLSGEDPSLYRLSQIGPYPVTRDLLSVNMDGAEVMVQAPSGIGRGNLVVLSHGVLTDPRVYRRMILHLASHGFVVAAPLHDDGILKRGLSARAVDITSRGSWDVQELIGNETAWSERAKACSAILDKADRLGATLQIGVDQARPVLIGHEFGAFSTMLSMGATTDTITSNLRDDRWYASALLSPQGPGVMGLTQGSWDSMSRSMLTVIGGQERDFFGQTPIVKASSFALSPTGNKHLAWFENADENLYTGPRAGVDQTEQRRFEDFLAVLTAFCIAYARYEEEMFAKLASDWIERQTLSRVAMRYR